MKKNALINLVLGCILLGVNAVRAQNNVISQDRWVAGTPANQLTPEFEASGGATRNFIEAIDNPFGESSPIWRAKLAVGEINRYPGFKTVQVRAPEIDVNKDYRYSVWVKTNANQVVVSSLIADNTGYDFEIGANGPINQRVTINSNKNIPRLNEWFLLVSYVRAANSSEADDSFETKSGYYEVGGNQVVSNLGWTIGRFHPTKTNVNFKIGQQYYARTDAHEVFFYNPRFEPIDGQEPNITDLTNPNWMEPSIDDPSGTSKWSSNTNGINYINGNVGIGVTNPDAPLTVKGQIHTNEVKVDIAAPIVPDYVFFDDYQLKSLEEVELFIKDNGHLPNVPSAEQFAKEGMELKQMNFKLLEKIEELTLYIVQQENKLKVLNEARQIEKEHNKQQFAKLQLDILQLERRIDLKDK